MPDAEEDPKAPRGAFLEPARSIAGQAKVVSAFMRAFGFALGKGLRGEKPIKTQVAAQIQAIPEGTSRLWGRNARLVIEEHIALLISDLQAELEVLDKLQPLIPEQPEKYVFKIQRGQLAMDGESISALMNKYAFAGQANPPLDNIRISLPDGRIVMEATFHAARFLHLPLRLAASVAVTPEGMIELTPREIRAGALPVDRLMGMLGLELGRMMPAEGVRGMAFVGDRIRIDPLGMFPAPKATGRLVAVEVKGGHLVMSYDDGSATYTPPLVEADADSYMAMVGHDLLVGKITMTDICLQLVPMDAASGWVEFSLPNYRRQLARGESHLDHADRLLYKLPPVSAL